MLCVQVQREHKVKEAPLQYNVGRQQRGKPLSYCLMGREMGQGLPARKRRRGSFQARISESMISNPAAEVGEPAF
jgi:hypothetical protein